MFITQKAKLSCFSISMVLHGTLLFVFSSKVDHQKIHYSKINSSFTATKTTLKIIKEQKKAEPKKVLKPKKVIKKLKRRVVKQQKSMEADEVRKVLISSNKGRNDKLNLFTKKVRNLIKSFKHYPRVASRLKQKGEVIVAFEVSWPNKINNIHFIKKTPYKLLNNSALNSVKKINGLAQVPAEFKNQVIKLEVPLNFDQM